MTPNRLTTLLALAILLLLAAFVPSCAANACGPNRFDKFAPFFGRDLPFRFDAGQSPASSMFDCQRKSLQAGYKVAVFKDGMCYFKKVPTRQDGFQGNLHNRLGVPGRSIGDYDIPGYDEYSTRDYPYSCELFVSNGGLYHCKKFPEDPRAVLILNLTACWDTDYSSISSS
ncbi:hypothetical protein BCR44DRAFT_328808 [Catenaria anguillulae PL171]|uniref:Uncharacterized protein n=1 Tax=Catenaria anguillulae PL171 TaxID=765915 RepID=A0A1Y2HPF0_9FUNG|nr:hypothetical protein BCR44DRAFT_328808 [Catenaria anguillulae PL171]